MLPEKSMFRPKDEGFMPMCTAVVLVSLTILSVALPYLRYLDYVREDPAGAAWAYNAVSSGDSNHGSWFGTDAGNSLASCIIALFLLPGCTTLLGVFITATISNPDTRHWIKLHWITIVLLQIGSFLFLTNEMGWLVE